MKRFICLIVIAGMLWGMGNAFADALPPKTAAYQSSVSQEQLRLETRRQEVEMLEVLSKLKRYSFTEEENGELKGVLGKLDHVAEKDMPEVVRLLREASQNNDAGKAKATMLNASSGQKQISSELRSMADDLLLMRDRADLETRIRKLALRQKDNLRATAALAQHDALPAKVPEAQRGLLALSQMEQEAMANEMKLLRGSLERLLQKGQGDKQPFQAALDTYRQRELDQHAEKSAERIKHQLQEAERLETKIHEGLVQMLVSLDRQKSKEQQLRELAAEVHEVATQQGRLAQSVAKAKTADQDSLKQVQQVVADQLEIAKKQLQETSREQTREAEAVQKEAEQLADRLKQERLLDDVKEVAKLADAQAGAAENMRELERSLLEQAQEVAENDATNPQRQAEALAEKLAAMAEKQRQLAAQTQKSEDKDEASKELHREQREIAKELEKSQAAVQNLSPEAAGQTSLAREQSQAVDKRLAKKHVLKEQANREGIAADQNQIADQLQAASEALQEKANAIAQNRQAQPTPAAAKAMAEQLKAMAEQQKQVASQTQQSEGRDQHLIEQQQERIAAQLESAQAVVQALNQAAGEKTRQSTEQAKQAAEKLKEQGLLKDESKKQEMASQQNQLAEQLQSAAQDLQTAAEQMAQAAGEQPSAEALDSMADKMQALAQQQEALGTATNESKGSNQEVLKQQQEALNAAIQQSQAEASQIAMNESASAAAQQAQQAAQQAQQGLQEQGSLSNAEKKGQIATQQAKAAEQLQQAGNALRAQANEMKLAQMAPEEAAIADAMHQVMTARSQIEMAGRQLQAEPAQANPTGVKERLAKADEAFAEALESTEKISSQLNQKANEAIGKGQQEVQAADQRLSVTKPEGAGKETEVHLTEAKAQADVALNALQQAALKLAQQKQDAAKQMAANGKPGKPGQSGKEADGAEDFIDSEKENSDFSAISKLRSGQRDALELLKQEKVSPDYEAQVQQYIRNLADGQLPTK